MGKTIQKVSRNTVVLFYRTIGLKPIFLEVTQGNLLIPPEFAIGTIIPPQEICKNVLILSFWSNACSLSLLVLILLRIAAFLNPFQMDTIHLVNVVFNSLTSTL
jgi:hypothetical protein